jgi:serine/threonine protein kinase
MPLNIGDMVGPYQIEAQIGTGGMATVYKAFHARLNRRVALKIIHPMLLEDPTFVARFEREAQIVASLDHPHILPIYDFNEHGQQPYLVMKLIEGQTLKALMQTRTLSLHEINALMTPIAAALTFSHQRGVLHRDIKPSNVMLSSDGTPFLTDYGLARIARVGATSMSGGMMLGTPQYISPEQARGDSEIDGRTDVYSFAVMLFEMATGRVPFSNDTTPYAVVNDHIHTPPPIPSSINPALNATIDSVLLRGMAKDPSQRYESASALMADFTIAINEAADVSVRRAVPTIPLNVNAGQIVPPVPPTPPRDARKPKDVSGVPLSRPVGNFEQRIEAFANRVERVADVVDREINRAADGLEGSSQRRKLDRASEKLERLAERMESRRASRESYGIDEDEWDKDDEDWDADDERALQLELATDEASIRKRAKKRIEERNGFFTHATWYGIIIGMMWLFAIIGGDFGDSFMAPLITTFAWGAGIWAHAAHYFTNSGKRLERRAAKVEQVMIENHGTDWEYAATDGEYQRVRRFIYKQHHRMSEFASHLAVFVNINIMLFAIYFAASFENGRADFGFPWPLIVLGAWGAGVLAHGAGVFGQSHKLREETAIQREIERERALDRSGATALGKRKNDNDINSLLDEDAPVRLTQDGEFTDSIAREIDPKRNRR